MARSDNPSKSEMHRRKVQAAQLGVSVDELPDRRGKHGRHARGAANGKWNADDVLRSSHGYVLIRVGPDHPLAMGNGYAYLHEVVWCSAGRELPRPNGLLHHRDHDKGNNRLDNLEAISRSDHAVHHNADRTRTVDGRYA